MGLNERKEMSMPADSKANTAWKKENTKQLMVRFYQTDMAIFDYIKSQDNIAQYIKGLVKADMESKGIEVVINEPRPRWPRKED